MSGIQWKIIWHVKKQENVTYNEEESQLIKTNQNWTQKLDLAETLRQLL